jgi:hypothetical protein
MWNFPKKYTASQKALLEISTEPIDGFQVDIVVVQENYCGLTTTLKSIQKNPFKNKTGPVNYVIDAVSPWDVVMEMNDLMCDRNCFGCGYFDTLWRVLKHIGNARPICLWMEGVNCMRPSEREMIVYLLEHVCDQLNIEMRVVLLLSKAAVWDKEQRRRVLKFVHSSRLDKRARKWSFDRAGLEEVLGKDTDTEKRSTKLLREEPEEKTETLYA